MLDLLLHFTKQLGYYMRTDWSNTCGLLSLKIATYNSSIKIIRPHFLWVYGCNKASDLQVFQVFLQHSKEGGGAPA